MPADGVEQFVLAFGKGAASRAQMSVFDEAEAVQVEQRAAPGTQDIQLYDVALLAHHFGASRISALFRMKNLRQIDDREFQRLKAEEDSGAGQAIATFLAAPEAPEKVSRDDFRRRFLALALETYRRDEITRSKLAELAAMVHLAANDLQAALTSANLD